MLLLLLRLDSARVVGAAVDEDGGSGGEYCNDEKNICSTWELQG